MDTLQHENENLNETVRELRDRLMLHAEDDSDVDDEECAEKAHDKAKSMSSYAAPYFPTANLYHTS